MLGRRSLLLASGAGALLAVCGGDSGSPPARPGVTRADIALLNELLAFEHLEAAFYRVAADRDERFAALALRIEERRAAASLDVVSKLQNAGLLAAGLSMHAVEARHVIALRDVAGVALAPTQTFGAPLAAAAALAEVRTWLA